MPDSSTTAQTALWDAIAKIAPEDWTADDCCDAASKVREALRGAGFRIMKETDNG